MIPAETPGLFYVLKSDTRHLYKNGFKNSPGIRYLDGDELKKFQNVLLSILKDFVVVAERNKLMYTLGGGSALGAVRHHGFIPWDDDIDVMMSRKDYNRFRSIFDQELGEEYIFCSPEDGRGHGLAHSQIKKKGTVYRSFNELSKSDEECGIGIDIFVLEIVPDNPILRLLHGTLCLAAGYLLTCRKTYDDYPYIRRYLGNNKKLLNIYKIKRTVGALFSWVPLDGMARFTNWCYSLWRNNESRLVGIPSGRKHYFGEIHRRMDLVQGIIADFEGLNVRIPKGYDRYLSMLYGTDYMKVPENTELEKHPVMELRVKNIGRITICMLEVF